MLVGNAATPGRPYNLSSKRSRALDVRSQTAYAPPPMARRVKRGVIVAKIEPGAEEKVAEIFAESDRSELPGLAGVTHRSLFVLEDVYIHYVEMDEDFTESVDQVRDHPLFREISRKLDEYITPYNPETWRSPKDATAREFYTWDADSSE
jgi:cyclase